MVNSALADRVYINSLPSPCEREETMMNHKILVVQTVLIAQKYKMIWHYCTDSRECQGSPGFPDLVVAGEVTSAFIELKTADDDTTAQQDLWRYRISMTPMEYKLYRPADLLDGTIETYFRSIA